MKGKGIPMKGKDRPSQSQCSSTIVTVSGLIVCLQVLRNADFRVL